MLSSVLITKLFIDALGLLGAGMLFSLMLIKSRVFLARAFVAYTASFLASLLCILIAILTIKGGEAISFTLPSTFQFIPFSFRIDLLGSVFLFILGVVGAAASLYGASYSRHYDTTYNTAYLGIIFNAFIASIALVITANDAFFFMIAWELMSLTSYLLIIFEYKKAENIQAGFFYFIMMHIGATAIIGALFTLAHSSGTTNFDYWRLGQQGVPMLAANVAFVLALIGFGIKAGMIPLHTWLPRAHPAAPAHVSALMSGVMIKTALLLLVRFVFEFLPTPDSWWGPLLIVIGAVTAVLGILEASGQTDLKRLLAFSSIENIGLMTMTLGAAVVFLGFHVSTLAAIALIAFFFHIVNHAMFKGLLFLTAGTVVASTGTANMEKLGGVIRYLPRTAIAFFIAALAVSAFPPFNGFASEWLIFQTMIVGLSAPYFYIKAVFIGAIIALAIASGITILAFAKAFGSTFLARPRFEKTTDIHEATLFMQLGYGVLTLMIVLLGLCSKIIISFFERIALTVGSEKIAVNPDHGLNMPVIDMIPTAVVMVTVLIFVIAIIKLKTRGNTEEIGDTWDCGYPLYPNNEISATAFSRTILMFLKKILPTTKTTTTILITPESPYFMSSKTVTLEIADTASKYIYSPIIASCEWLGRKAKRIQNGNLNAYILYILMALILLVTLYI